MAGCDSRPRSIVVYTSVDDQVARPIIDDFTRETGISVDLVTDTEATKSIGLAERLRAEKSSPRCDVWWCNEPFNTIALAQEGAFVAYDSPQAKDIPARFRDPQNRWTASAYRLRVLIMSEPDASAAKLPGLAMLTEVAYRGKVAMARPVAGTCASQMAALSVLWGQDKFEKFLLDLKNNDIKLLGGNSVVAEEVAKGTLRLGLTDNDDVLASQQSIPNSTAKLVLPDQHDQGALALPTSVALVKDSSDSRKLADFLLSRNTQKKLIDAHYAYGQIQEIDRIKTMDIDYQKAAANLRSTIRRTQEILEGR